MWKSMPVVMCLAFAVSCGGEPETAVVPFEDVADTNDEPADVPVAQPPVAADHDVSVVYVMSSTLRLRESPSPTSPVVTTLAINSKLRVLAPPKEDWFQVTSPTGRNGWVHGDFVAAHPLDPERLTAQLEAADNEQDKLKWAQRAAAVNPNDAAALKRLEEAYIAVGDRRSADAVAAAAKNIGSGFDARFPKQVKEVTAISEALPTAETAAEVVALWRRALVVTDALAEPLNAQFSHEWDTFDAGALDAMIADRLPWVFWTLYAEGTFLMFELKTDVWVDAAKRTPEPWDDAFIALLEASYDNAAGRGWATWHERSWDYGGCSPFGNGKELHLKLLLQTDALAGHPEISDQVLKIREGLMRDIAQPGGVGEFPYCNEMDAPTPNAGLAKEANAILKTVNLADRERATIENRLAAKFEPR